MILDTRLIGTKCETCFHARELPLEQNPPPSCARCLDRPNRKKDKSEYQPDIEDADTKSRLDEIETRETKFDY